MEAKALAKQIQSADFVVLLIIHHKILKIQADLNKKFQKKDIMVGQLGSIYLFSIQNCACLLVNETVAYLSLSCMFLGR